MRQKFITAASLIILTSVFLFLSCCEDCPPCPTCPQPPEPGSYYVYIGDDNQQAPAYIWIVDSKTDSVIDSMFTPGDNITIMETSPDGNFLAVLIIDIDSVFIFDLIAREVVADLPSGIPYFTPDNQYLLIADMNSDGTESRFYKYSVPDWTLTADTTLAFAVAGIFNNQPYIFGHIEAKEYYIFDYETMTMVKTGWLRRPDGSTPQFLDIITSPDDSCFFFTSRPNKIFRFEIETDSIVDSIYIVYGAYRGVLKCTRDGQYLLLTETTQYPDDPVGNLLMIELPEFRIYGRITTWGLNPLFPGFPLLPGNVAVTPDGSKAFCGRGSMALLPPVSFNLWELRGTNIKGLPSSCSAVGIAVGKQIQK